MQHLWAPWRLDYILSDKSGPCVFCGAAAAPDSDLDKLFVLHRSPLGFVILNLYPYNNGHLMVVPNRHVSKLTELSLEEHTVLSDMLARGIKALEECMRPEGFNVGMNLGKVGGAGIDQHIHWHIVPRWTGDTNFMPVISDTRVVSEYVSETYRKLKCYFK